MRNFVCGWKPVLLAFEELGKRYRCYRSIRELQQPLLPRGKRRDKFERKFTPRFDKLSRDYSINDLPLKF